MTNLLLEANVNIDCTDRRYHLMTSLHKYLVINSLNKTFRTSCECAVLYCIVCRYFLFPGHMVSKELIIMQQNYFIGLIGIGCAALQHI